MNALESLLDKPVFQALGWTLIHFIWQGALIAIFSASLSVLLRRFSANVRYAAACSAMLLMLVAPATTMLVISGNTISSSEGSVTADASPANQTFEQVAPLSINEPSTALQSKVEAAPPLQPSSIKQWIQDRLPRAMPWLLAMWFAGVLFLSLRFAGGLMMIQRLKRVETGATNLPLQETLALLTHRLRVSRPVRLCESALVEVPTVIGWLRPLILLPATALTGLSPVQLEALLAHELAHIRRYDYLVNLLQTSIETLFFYHPAVWWVSAQVRQEREHCCDDLAVAACGDVLTYARALTALEQLRRAEPRLAVAASGGSLLVRIQRLLRGRPPAFYKFESGLAGFIALATVLILLTCAQTALFSRNAKAFVKDGDTLTPADLNSGPAFYQPVSTASPDKRVPRTTDKAAAVSNDEPSTVAEHDAISEQDTAGIVSSESNQEGDFLAAMSAAGLSNLKADQLTALKSNGVTTQFVREIKSLAPANLTVNRIIAMRIHGVSAAFAEELKAQGLANLTAEQLIAFRIHGVTSQFIAELKNAGYSSTSVNSLLAFRIHSVTPAFIQQLKELGFANLAEDQLIAFRIHGVTPLFIQTMRSFIRETLSANDLVALRIHGISPERIKELEIMGIGNLTANQLIAFGVHGITSSFIKSIQDAGYDRLTPNQLIELRIFGVTPEFIRLVKDRGFTDVTLHQLTELRRLNILPSAKKN